MKGWLVGITSLLLSSLAIAGPATVSEVVYKQQGESYNRYRLPWVTQNDNPASAKRINDFIFSRFAQQLPGADPQATLNRIGQQGIEQTASLDFELVNNKNNILTINIIAEGCGAYCETYSNYTSFDLTTGANIDLDDIISPPAVTQLNQQVKSDIRHQITAFIEAQNNLPLEQKVKDEGEVVDYQQFYADCWAMTMDDVSFVNKFFLDNGQLVFNNERCSNHASRALDDLGEFTSKIPVSELTGQFTPFGQNLIIDRAKTSVSPPAKLSGRTLYGTLGSKTPIVLSVSCSHNYIHGAYFYAQYGAPIELNGKCQSDSNQSYTMTTASGDIAAEQIELRLKDGIYQGTWSSNGKTLPLVIDLP